MSLILDGTNGLSDVDGSASTPAIRGTDTNTGIFFPAADTIAFAEGGAEVARFDSSGNFGVGTTTPASTLDVVATGVATATVRTSSTTGSRDAKLRLNVPSTGGDDPSGQIEFTYGTGYTVAGSIQMTHTSPNMKFFTGANERMRLDNSGLLLVNTTSTLSNGVVQIKGVSNTRACMTLGVATNGNAAIDFQNASNGFAGSIVVNASSVAYNTSSDYRLKENVAPMIGALAKVQALKPVTYTWKADGSDGQGFIAHELAEVVPDAVTGEKDAVNEDGTIKAQGIDTSFLVATLTAAIQELKAELDSVKAELATLKA
jgi:hypothetical protein